MFVSVANLFCYLKHWFKRTYIFHSFLFISFGFFFFLVILLSHVFSRPVSITMRWHLWSSEWTLQFLHRGWDTIKLAELCVLLLVFSISVAATVAVWWLLLVVVMTAMVMDTRKADANLWVKVKLSLVAGAERRRFSWIFLFPFVFSLL